MRLLGVLGARGVHPGGVRQVAVAVGRADRPADRLDRLLAQLHAIGSHVGDQADRLAVDVHALVEALGELHGSGRAEAELARRLLLQGRGGERRLRVAPDALLVDLGDGEVAGLDRRHRGLGVGFVGDVQAVELAAVEVGQAGGERLPLPGPEVGLDAPVFLGPELLDLGLALADQAQGHRLHAPGRLGTGQLAPEHRRQREADQIVERPAGQIGVDQVLVEGAGPGDRLQHRRLGDLVERHPLDVDAVQRPPLFQNLLDVPADGLALAIRVGGEDQVVGALQGLGDGLDLLLGPRVGLPEHREIVLGIHRAVLRRQVADVPVAGEDVIVVPQVLVDRLGLGRGLDDDDCAHAAGSLPCEASDDAHRARGR